MKITKNPKSTLKPFDGGLVLGLKKALEIPIYLQVIIKVTERVDDRDCSQIT